MPNENVFPLFEQKMQSLGVGVACIQAFRGNYEKLLAGDFGTLPESAIAPLAEVPDFAEVTGRTDASLLGQTVILKLNGGLGTGMGLAKPKSLLPIKQTDTFLDFIVRQILHLRRETAQPLAFLLMNSRSTQADTRMFLDRYPELGEPAELELLQGYVPKVDAKTMEPVSWPASPDLEWCPPGHGDLYASLLGSGWLDRLLARGVRHMFVSNSDNLGASLDLGLLTYFASSNLSFLMEVAQRTPADRKGGHLARGHDGRLLLRESAQCPDTDLKSFQDVDRHRYFNTNNLWIRLDHLKQKLDAGNGILPLPLITNRKNVDPRDRTSPEVFQLETAMGAAIGTFDQTGAVLIPRSRFAPVKTTSDLLAIRSDAYDITPDWRLALNPARKGRPPLIELDNHHYKTVDQLDRFIPVPPSLRDSDRLELKGPIEIAAGVVFQGVVTATNPASEARLLAAGVYRDTTIQCA